MKKKCNTFFDFSNVIPNYLHQKLHFFVKLKCQNRITSSSGSAFLGPCLLQLYYPTSHLLLTFCPSTFHETWVWHSAINPTWYYNIVTYFALKKTKSETINWFDVKMRTYISYKISATNSIWYVQTADAEIGEKILAA